MKSAQLGSQPGGRTERASFFHRSANDLSSEVPESHAPADGRLLTHEERHECWRSGGEREEARDSYPRADRCILTPDSAPG